MPPWQARARALVAANIVAPFHFLGGRVYVALSVAQYRAAVTADEQVRSKGTLPDNGFADGGHSRYEALRGQRLVPSFVQGVLSPSLLVLTQVQPSLRVAGAGPPDHPA
jgi:hypothetical protein